MKNYHCGDDDGINLNISDVLIILLLEFHRFDQIKRFEKMKKKCKNRARNK